MTLCIYCLADIQYNTICKQNNTYMSVMAFVKSQYYISNENVV